MSFYWGSILSGKPFLIQIIVPWQGSYDMLSTALVNPADKEDLALTLNGKKKKITRNDFIAAFRTLDLDPKQQENI